MCFLFVINNINNHTHKLFFLLMTIHLIILIEHQSINNRFRIVPKEQLSEEYKFYVFNLFEQ